MIWLALPLGLWLALVTIDRVTRTVPLDLDATDITFALRASGYKPAARFSRPIAEPTIVQVPRYVAPALEDRPTVAERAWLNPRISREQLTEMPYHELRKLMEET